MSFLRTPIMLVRHLAGWFPWRNAAPKRRLLIGVGIITAVVIAVGIAVGALSASLIVGLFSDQESFFGDGAP